MNRKEETMYVVDGDTLAEVTTTTQLYPRVVDWQELLDAVKIEPEDGWSLDDLVCDVDAREFKPVWNAPEDAREYWRRQDTVATRHGVYQLTLTLQAEKESRSYYRALRARGASRQVARECVAADKAAALRSARRLLAEKVGVYWFALEFRGVGASVGMVTLDDTIPGGDQYQEDVKAELAAEVAGELENRGFIIAGRPEVAPTPRRFYGTYPGPLCFIPSQLPRAIETDRRRAARGSR